MRRTALLLGYPLLLLAQGPDYQGPSVLSRGGFASTVATKSQIALRPYIGLSSLYDSGLTGVSRQPDGSLPNVSDFGVQATIGLYGYHIFRHTTVGLDYRGSYSHFSRNPYYDGSDQFLSFGMAHQLNRRTTIRFQEVGGTYSRNFFFSTAAGVLDPAFLNLPNNELFDNRVIFLQTGADVTYQKSVRLSFNVGGRGYLIRRRASSLFGVTGSSAHGDLVYRLSRHFTLGAAYDFTHFEFTKAFGATDIHAARLLVASRLSPSVELSLTGGASRVETLHLVQVAVDPEVAAITGQTTGINASYKVRYVPIIQARLSKKLTRSLLAFSYERAVSPGNGVYLTSISEHALGTYSFTGLRHWHLAVNAGYERMSALAQTIGKYEAYRGGCGVTRDLTHGLQLVIRLDERFYKTNYANFQRHGFQAAVGFAWSPGDVPLSLW